MVYGMVHGAVFRTIIDVRLNLLYPPTRLTQSKGQLPHPLGSIRREDRLQYDPTIQSHCQSGFPFYSPRVRRRRCTVRCVQYLQGHHVSGSLNYSGRCTGVLTCHARGGSAGQVRPPPTSRPVAYSYLRSW